MEKSAARIPNTQNRKIGRLKWLLKPAGPSAIVALEANINTTTKTASTGWGMRNIVAGAGSPSAAFLQTGTKGALKQLTKLRTMAHNSRAELQMAELALAVHGILVAFHCLGIAYNAKRGNKFDVICHTAAAAYDVWAVDKHLRDVMELKDVS